MQEEDILMENMLIFHLWKSTVNIDKVFLIIFAGCFSGLFLRYIKFKLFKHIDKYISNDCKNTFCHIKKCSR